MEKRKRTASPPPKLEQLITEDGILCSIISSLPLRDAVRTCVLSSRWRHIWTHLTKLKFDAANVFGIDTMECYEWPDKFIGAVDSVLQQHQGATLEKLCFKYLLHDSHSRHLDAWVRFGVESKTRSLSLDLQPPLYNGLVNVEPYGFPCHMLGGHKGLALQRLSLGWCSLKLHHGFDGLSNLKRLDLEKVDVTEEDIRCLLSNCFSLMSLSVRNCRQLVTLNSSRPLSQLWFLYVERCNQLRKIEIDARNLFVLFYIGDWVDLIFRESSRLTTAFFYFQSDENVDFALDKLSRSLPHLEHLELYMIGFHKVADVLKGSISFTRLTQLNWTLDNKINLLCLASLLDAAPLLEEFKLQCWTVEADIPPPGPRVLSILPECSHTRLRTVKIDGFYGDNWQIEIAIYILKNATKLESMTIVARHVSSEEICELATEYFSHEVPVDVNFVIL